MDGETDGWMDGHTDDQCETIIPRHYCVVVYKKLLFLELCCLLRESMETAKQTVKAWIAQVDLGLRCLHNSFGNRPEFHSRSSVL